MDQTDLDERLDALDDRADDWVELELSERIDLLDAFITRTAETAPEQVEEAARHKGFDPEGASAGEEWLAGPVAALRTARSLRNTLRQIDETGEPPVDDSDIRRRPSGQIAVEVFPRSSYDSLLFNGFSAEIWLDPEVDREDVDEHLAPQYRHDTLEAGVSLVLGAGNVASIPPLDVLHRLFSTGRVCMLKLNPVNEYLDEFLEHQFEPFVDRDFVDITRGDADVGAYLCEHDLVDDIHITGSDRTHDHIVFGENVGADGPDEEDEPKLQKPITSELGNVSPVIAVPGPWSERDIRFHAENIASQLANNAGFNCNAARVLVLPETWDRADALLDAVESVLAELETRDAYYPGSEDRFEDFVDAHDDVALVGDPADGELPYAILRDVDPTRTDHPAFRDESWCTAMASTRLDGDDPAAFLRNAVDFCNDVLWGTLNASLLVHPETRRDLGTILEEAVDDLRYGSVVLNHWPALSYALGTTAWGAFPGAPLHDIQSGRGWVHNSLLIEDPQKTVVDGPFIYQPKPPWFVTNSAAGTIAESLAEFEAEPSFTNFVRVGWASIFG